LITYNKIAIDEYRSQLGDCLIDGRTLYFTAIAKDRIYMDFYELITEC